MSVMRRRRWIFLRALLPSPRGNLQWRSVDLSEDYVKSRNHVRASTDNIISHDGGMETPVDAFEAQPEQHDFECGLCGSQRNDFDKDATSEIMGVMNRYGRQFQGTPAGMPNTRPSGAGPGSR